MEYFIKGDGVGRSYAGVSILQDLGLEVGRGEFACITGGSGSGKTTLLNILGGLDTGYSGSVIVDGIELHGLNDAALSLFRRRVVGFVFQHFNLIEHMDCLGNVMLPACFSGMDSTEAHSRAMGLLERVGMDGLAGRRPPLLSGGERQRVAIARALFMKPGLLLCDEPTGDLDIVTAMSVMELFDSLRKEEMLTIVVATHDKGVYSRADRVFRMSGCGLVEEMS